MSPPGPCSVHAAAGEGNTVEVTLSDFAIDMPTELPVGRTEFNVTNTGQAPHNFKVECVGIEVEL